MMSFIRKKANSISKISLQKVFQIREQLKTENNKKVSNTIENRKYITLNNTKKEENSNNYRKSTLPTETIEKSSINYKTILIPHTLKNKNQSKKLNELYNNTLFKTKMILRPKTTIKPRIKKRDNIKKNPNTNILFKYLKKNALKEKLNGVPSIFIESMRLNLNQNIAQADLYLKQEKKRLIKENPIFKYQLLYEENQRKKREELEKVIQYKLWKKHLKNNKNIYDGNILNEYHSKQLLEENHQYFSYIRPIIDKSKFDSKYRLLTEENQEYQEIQIKYKELSDIRKIFSRYLDNNKLKIKSEIKSKKTDELSKKLIYDKFKTIIKKCAIEFKNIIIPFEEYIQYNFHSKKMVEYLFNDEYCELIKIIKREFEPNKEKKEKEAIKFISSNKSIIHTLDFYVQNILYLTIRYQLYKTLSKIIQLGAHVNHQDFKGRTVLHFAAKNNDLTSVVILLYYFADPFIKDNDGKSPLDYALYNGQDNYIIKELFLRFRLIEKFIKYKSWKEYDIYFRRGIQYFLIHNISKEKYLSIFSNIEKVNLYYS